MKTYVLMCARTFPVKHPRAGQPTDFKRKMLSGVLTGQAKLHTIRENYERWSQVVEEVNGGRAVLSCRQWKGRPYASRQEEFLKVTKLGIQRIRMYMDHEIRRMNVEGVLLSRDSVGEVIRNDGLTRSDFHSWFGYREFNGCIIHFSRLRYPIEGNKIEPDEDTVLRQMKYAHN